MEFKSLRKLALSLLTLTTETLGELTKLLKTFKPTLKSLSIENKGPLSPELKSCQNYPLEQTAEAFRNFCR